MATGRRIITGTKTTAASDLRAGCRSESNIRGKGRWRMTNASKPTTIMLPVTISTGADIASMESEITTLRARVAELEGEVERVRAFWEAECKRIADERDALNVEIVTQYRSMAVERGLLSRCERPDVVAALRLQLEQSKAEVERLTKERDAATASLDNWIRVARATAAEKERDIAEAAWKTSMDDLAQSARENERRAEAAEAREAGLRVALVCIRAFARPIWSDARCGDEMRKIDADCLDDICDMVDVALAAPAKEVKP
jgi:hypothetical protein